MKENSPLLVSTNISNFTVTSFASWGDIADLLDISEQFDLSLSPAEVANTTLEESFEWATQYERVNGKPPSEADTLFRENDIVTSVKQYYTAERIVSEQLDLEPLVKDINEWSLRGPDRPHLFGNIPDSGVGLQYFKSDLGVSFTAYAPFMIPYIELFYDRTQASPDWGLREIDGLDVVESMVQLQYKLNKILTFNLHDEADSQVWNRGLSEVY